MKFDEYFKGLTELKNKGADVADLSVMERDEGGGKEYYVIIK